MEYRRSKKQKLKKHEEIHQELYGKLVDFTKSTEALKALDINKYLFFKATNVRNAR